MDFLDRDSQDILWTFWPSWTSELGLSWLLWTWGSKWTFWFSILKVPQVLNFQYWKPFCTYSCAEDKWVGTVRIVWWPHSHWNIIIEDEKRIVNDKIDKWVPNIGLSVGEARHLKFSMERLFCFLLIDWTKRQVWRKGQPLFLELAKCRETSSQVG